MRLSLRTLSILFIFSIAPSWEAAPEIPPAIFYLASGEEIQAKPSAMNGNILLVVTDNRERKIALSQIVAVKAGGELTNGPFEASRIREILGLPAPSEAPDPPSPSAPSVAADSGESGYGPEYYEYGQTFSPSYLTAMPGQPPRSSGTVTKVFRSCVSKEGLAKCGPPIWIGLFGENLSTALAKVPEAQATAERIKTTTAIQGLALVSLPFFFVPAISLANGPTDEYGKVHTHIGPASIILFALTGTAFANYVGWNIYEGHIARKAIRIYDEKMGIKLSAGPTPSGGAFAAEIGF